MLDTSASSPIAPILDSRTSALLHQHSLQIWKRTDKLFAGLLVFEWLAAIVAALVVSPRTWAGSDSQVHIHVWAAFGLGAAIVSLPVLLAFKRPGELVTRLTVAVAQSLMSALLIHLSGGRIETHFHIFGSLAFLAFYRDWRVLLTATLVIAGDHVVRGIYWPQSVFGVLAASPWRALEHAGWVLFEVAFLSVACVQGIREMRSIATQRAQLELTNAAVEEEVARRTTELLESQTQLQVSEAKAKKLALVASRTNNAVIIADATGRIEWVNDSFTRINGMTHEQVHGRGLIETLLGEEADPAGRESMERHIRVGQPCSVEISKTTGTNRKIWVALEVQTVHDDANQLTNYIAIEQDITEQKKATERITIAVEAAPNGMVMMRNDGIITLVNSRTEETFGYQRDELIGQSIEVLVPDRHRDKHPQLRQEYIKSPVARSMHSGADLYGQRKDGTEFPVEIGLNPIETDEGMFVLAAIVDVTERKKAEADLREYAEVVSANNSALQQYADEAKAASRAKSEFLANMSHELRTPLNAVIGFSEGLLERTDRHPLNDHQKDRLTKIRKSGQHLLSLINNVLDIAKVESGKVEVYQTEFDVAELADEIAALAEGLLKDKPRVAFQVHIASAVKRITTDRDKAKQVLINLLGNAVKFTDSGSITLRISENDEHLNFSVEDTGLGIPDNELHQVFEKFHQVDQGTHRSIKGTGLGLSLCRSFAELLGGALTVRSTEGEGSVFTLSVPRSFDPECRQEVSTLVEELRAQCPSDSDSQLRVLCIEDDTHSMQVLADALQSDDICVIPAFDGEEGLRIAKAELPDAITLDVMLPGMDGWAVLRQLKDNPETCRIPVIMTTAIDDQKLALNLGADGFFAKPIDQQRLLTTIGQFSKPTDDGVRHVAIVDDQTDVLEIIGETVQEEGYQVTCFDTGAKFLESLSHTSPNVVILDLMMPDMDGFEVLHQLRTVREYDDIQVIIMTAKILTKSEMEQLNGKIRTLIEKNGLSRERALGQLITQLERLNSEGVFA